MTSLRSKKVTDQAVLFDSPDPVLLKVLLKIPPSGPRTYFGGSYIYISIKSDFVCSIIVINCRRRVESGNVSKSFVPGAARNISDARSGAGAGECELRKDLSKDLLLKFKTGL